MRFTHPEHPGRGVRLGYCLNLVPAEDLDGVFEGLSSVTVPLADRLFDRKAARTVGEGFGVGLWLPYYVVLELSEDPQGGKLARLARFLAENGLDAFTANAFPMSGFHRQGLKEKVFAPSWREPERMAYTLGVARILAESRRAFERIWADDVLRPRGGPHLSVSTHAGAFGAEVAGEEDLDAFADSFALCALHLARLEHETGLRMILALEPEPRSSANDTAELAAFHRRIRAYSAQVVGRDSESLRALGSEIVERHVGTCLDTCHAAVEFEAPESAVANLAGAPLGKLQFSSALAVRDPARNVAGREQLLAMDEPTYLHQTSARGRSGTARCTDLPELAAAVESGDPAWCEAAEWRCHFHVPVHLETLGAEDALHTTRDDADRILDLLLVDPSAWGSDELHLEIETYTWSVLPEELRRSGSLVDGLELEYRSLIGRLEAAGWRPIVEARSPTRRAR